MIGKMTIDFQENSLKGTVLHHKDLSGAHVQRNKGGMVRDHFNYTHKLFSSILSDCLLVSNTLLPSSNEILVTIGQNHSRVST